MLFLLFSCATALQITLRPSTGRSYYVDSYDTFNYFSIHNNENLPYTFGVYLGKSEQIAWPDSFLKPNDEIEENQKRVHIKTCGDCPILSIVVLDDAPVWIQVNTTMTINPSEHGMNKYVTNQQLEVFLAQTHKIKSKIIAQRSKGEHLEIDYAIFRIVKEKNRLVGSLHRCYCSEHYLQNLYLSTGTLKLEIRDITLFQYLFFWFMFIIAVYSLTYVPQLYIYLDQKLFKTKKETKSQ